MHPGLGFTGDKIMLIFLIKRPEGLARAPSFQSLVSWASRWGASPVARFWRVQSPASRLATEPPLGPSSSGEWGSY
jgi:hypothetical protein